MICCESETEDLSAVILQAVPARRSLAKQAAVHARRQDQLRRQRDLRELGGRHLRPVRPRGRQLPQLRRVLRSHQEQTQDSGVIIGHCESPSYVPPYPSVCYLNLKLQSLRLYYSNLHIT